MSYEIKAYMFRPEGNTLDLKFIIKLPTMEDMIEFLSRVCFLSEYDRVTVLPEDFNKEI